MGEARAVFKLAPTTISPFNSASCSEERLFSLGWKEFYGFYGDQDCFLRRPSKRELNLLSLTHTRRGGRVQPRESAGTDQKDEECNNSEHDLNMWSPLESRVTEEDCCLLRPIPNSLRLLPSVLFHSVISPAAPHLNHEVLRGRLATKADALLEMVGILYSHDAQAKTNSISLEGYSHDRLFLEDMPMLRNMAIYERAAFSIPDTEDTAHSRRRTRKSAKKCRYHYFESLNPSYPWGDESTYSATEVDKRLAAFSSNFRG